VIVERGDEAVSDEEGCLSMQGIQVPVERAPTVRLEGRDPEGGEISLDLSELGARVAQHELDHLDGVLIIDRTTEEARREALGVLRPRAVLAP
jgi:peptide deformylase